ncbi:hypothetical protein, partial [Acinetobacter baumannii]|uniref:hypothetical protein n=1 Tax=Acinetobacter baumannii TaxID=470 RepID=UPI000810A2C4
NNSFFIALNTAKQFIVIDAIGADFQIGHQIFYEGSKVINDTLNDETDSKVILKCNEKEAYEYLHQMK